MSVSEMKSRLQLPESLQTQLHGFRRRVWAIKAAEALCGALFGVLVSYLVLFALDRLIDTPEWTRLTIFAVAVGACSIVPLYFHRWIWSHRRLEQLARLLARRHPSLGDQVLGTIELVRSESEQARSRALCEAAIDQVAHEAALRDFSDAVPAPRHRLWAWLAGGAVAAALALVALFPAAATNAWARFLAPWQPVERYTFTSVARLPEHLVVPHGEPVTISIELLPESRWRPERGRLQLASQEPIDAELIGDRYDFELPPQIDEGWLYLKIGDARQRVRLEPKLRPELSAAMANVRLPNHLERTEPIDRDVRGGSVTLVRGSTATFTVTASRELSSARVDGQPRAPQASRVVAAPVDVDASRKVEFEWRDQFGLNGQAPFVISLTAREDEAPTLACEDLPRQRVVLDSETLNFRVRAVDDFGIKRIGMEWKGIDKEAVIKPAEGEIILAAGGSDKELLEIPATFSAQTLEIEPQPLAVRIFVEDYLPGRERVYSLPYVLYVLDAEQHAIWLTEQLSKWHRQSLEVRDREMQLHHTNQQLRMLSPEELDRPETRRQIEAQAAGERANGRRLTGLVDSGEELVRQAMRNPEFGVGHLEKWAEMLQILRDISDNRMPSVADLLKESAQAPSVASNPPSGPRAGEVRHTGGGPGESKPGETPPRPPVASVVDVESSQQPPDQEPRPPSDSESKPSNPRLTLPVTSVPGPGGKPPSGEKTPAGDKLDEAVAAQQDLLAEFDKIADELNKVLANLEGSTLVKRLKAAARKQYVVAGKIGEQLSAAFGRPGATSANQAEAFNDLANLEIKSSQDVSNIMDDMEAYFERRRFQRFKTVLEEMREQDAVGSLRQLSDDVRVEAGMSIAQCEFWSDTFDRWADDLVDPANSGKCPGCKSRGSLPPSIVLEAMKILEAEVNLREETRVTQQARAALETDEFGKRAAKLSQAQDVLALRVSDLAERIRELPDGEADFALEIRLLVAVEHVMDEATEILGRPDTGPTAIAAETEAIELLLQSRRFSPGGGGSGSVPGGGGGGTTNDSALALVGWGRNEKEVREDQGTTHATGESGSGFPEEFRAGLDEYFNQLERGADRGPRDGAE